jgi:hypothetical protein
MTSTSPPVPPVPSDPPADVRAARIGAKAAIAGAVIALVAALIGGLITGYYGTSTTNTQIDAQAQQARKAFVRSQLQAAASQLITDSTLADQDELDLYKLVSPPILDSSSDLWLQRNNALVDQVTKVQSDAANVQVLGWQVTNDATVQLYNHHLTLCNEMTDDIISGDNVAPDSPAFKDAIKKVSDDLDNFDSIQRKLISALQSDLDSGPTA